MKMWAGHFGALCSAACIRVKSEVTAAAGDSYSDIQFHAGANFTKDLDAMVRSLYGRHKEELTEMQNTMGQEFLRSLCLWKNTTSVSYFHCFEKHQI